MKRTLASKITNSQIDTGTWYELTLQTGAYGGDCVLLVVV